MAMTAPTTDVPPLTSPSEDVEDVEDVDVEETEETEEAEEAEEVDILSPPLSSLREISTLASWTVSTYKPGCGVQALRNPSPAQFWQSDGPQPHLLNIHFFKLVSIARLRIYLDLDSDESYTPTRMQFLAGHSEYDVVDFAEWRAPAPLEGPRGWVDIGLERCWGRGAYGDDDVGIEGEGEGVLRCMFLQIKVLENHQNGKDTHIRGVQIWAKDERDDTDRLVADRPRDKTSRVNAVQMIEDEVDAMLDKQVGAIR